MAVNFSSVLLTTVLTAFRVYVGSGVFDRIAAQVLRLSTLPEMSGAQKMRVVLDFASKELAIFSETLVRAVVELVLLKAQHSAS